MRAFKIWNKNRTSSFDLSGLNVITSDIAGLGNRFTNELYDGIIKKHLIHQYNSFEQINLTINFGVNSNAYQKYREFMNFIQANGRNILVIEYYTPVATRFVDVVLSNASKSQKTGFGVLVETVTFDRLTPYYIMYRRTGTSTLVSNNYMENVMPKIKMSGRTYPAGTKVRVKSKNLAIPDLEGKEYLGDGVYRVYDLNGITIDYNIYSGINKINGTSTSSGGFGYVGYIFDSSFNPMVMSFYPISGTRTPGNTDLSNYSSSGLPSSINHIYLPLDNTVASIIIGDPNNSEWGNMRNLNFYYANNITFNNYKFKLQLEKAGNNLELDRPIDELNGYTLREVFEDGNLFNTNETYNITVNDKNIPYYNVQTINNDINANYIRKRSNGLGINNIFYGVFDFIKISGLYNEMIEFYDNDTGITILIEDNITYSRQFTVIDILHMAYKSFQGISYVGEVQTIFNAFLIDQTILGIDTLTVEQMDYWFNQYKTLKTEPTEYSIPVTDTREIELNETILSNQKLIIDSENKIVTLNGVNAYQITNKDKSTFLNLPDGDYLIECDLPFELEYKKWVID